MPGQNNDYKYDTTADYAKMQQNMLKAQKSDEWEIWVNQNRLSINNMFKRWYGKPAGDRRLNALARGQGKYAALLYNRVNEMEKLETYLPTFHNYYGRNPSLGEARRAVRQFATPEEYGGWLKAGEETKAIMPEVKELWGTYAGSVPTSKYVQSSLAGRAGEATFQQKYEAFKARKEAAFKPEQAGIAFGTNKDTGLLGSPSLQDEWQY